MEIVQVSGMKIQDINEERVEVFKATMRSIAYRNTYVSRASQDIMVDRMINKYNNFMTETDLSAPILQETCKILGIYNTRNCVQLYLSGKPQEFAPPPRTRRPSPAE